MDEQMNVPSRTDHYLIQLTQEVIRTRGKSVKWKDLFIKFERVVKKTATEVIKSKVDTIKGMLGGMELGDRATRKVNPKRKKHYGRDRD